MQTDDDFRTFREHPVADGVPAVITARLYDAYGAPVAGYLLTALTFSLIDRDSGGYVNGHQDTDILNANGGTVATDGSVRLDLPGTDTVLVDAAKSREGRIARFRWQWTGGVGEGVHEVWFDVERVAA